MYTYSCYSRVDRAADEAVFPVNSRQPPLCANTPLRPFQWPSAPYNIEPTRSSPKFEDYLLQAQLSGGTGSGATCGLISSILAFISHGARAFMVFIDCFLAVSIGHKCKVVRRSCLVCGGRRSLSRCCQDSVWRVHQLCWSLVHPIQSSHEITKAELKWY